MPIHSEGLRINEVVRLRPVDVNPEERKNADDIERQRGEVYFVK